MILPGSEMTRRYPHIPSCPLKGIVVYGRTKENGQKAFKIPGGDTDRVSKMGYRIARRGTAYAYVTRGY